MLENANARTDVYSLEYERHHLITCADRVLDLGAHIGYFTEFLAPRCRFVLAFEPHPENFASLAERCRYAANTALVNAAAFHVSGHARLHECPANNGAHSLFKHGGCSEVFHEVPTVDIGPWLVAVGYAPDFIKIDTEGAEGAIIESLLGVGIVADMAVECHDLLLYWRCRNAAERAGLKWLPEIEHVGLCWAIKP
jgi:FkbM family methyltransferase